MTMPDTTDHNHDKNREKILKVKTFEVKYKKNYLNE